MPTSERPPSPEREQTDESLRVERAKADSDLAERMAAIEEAADEATEKVRARADQVLAAARAKADRQPSAPDSPPASAIEKERGREDRALEGERASADETLRAEREEQAILYSLERDETDQDLSRERARADDAVSARDAFLGIVSHDLRNMLSGMLGFAALIANAAPGERSEERIVQHAHRILRSGARMNRLVGDLVDVASIEAGVLAVTRDVGDPALAVTEAVDMFQAQAAASDVLLVADIASSVPAVAFDAARLLQVLTNLLSNALKFTPPRGKIVVRVEGAGDDVRFTVSDTGEGIPPGKLEAIFERYLQATENDPRGVGLGLYISKCIVQGHGGRIWADSTPGAGSTFSFTLPIHGAP